MDIIVPVYKCVPLAQRCLESLLENIHEIASHNPRLIVINDSPGEIDVTAMLSALVLWHPEVLCFENEQNMGFVRTVNRGLSLSLQAGRDALLVNADTETFPGTLQNLVEVAYSDPQIGFVSPRSNNASICSLPHVASGIALDPAEAHRRWRLISRTMPAFHVAPTAVGFYLFIKHTILANFGFLDAEFGVGYEEENDLILRANKAGYRAVLANQSFAYHVGSASFELRDLDLGDHRQTNIQMLARRHAEYIPLVRRYEASPHFRAEALLGNLLESSWEQPRVVFDFSAIGPNFNGTVEMSLAILGEFCRRHASRFEVHVICTEETFRFHRLERLEGLQRHDPAGPIRERFMIGINLGQPFNIHQVSLLEDLAVINVFGMLDTIADDCGYLSITHQLEAVWGHTARHASGLFFLGGFSEKMFLARYPQARGLSRYARLLPTRLANYAKPHHAEPPEHVLILGNHFAHKASESTARRLRAAFPEVRFVVFGSRTGGDGNVTHYRSGSMGRAEMDSLYNRASIVVLPSHVEGFGFGLVHALAAGKVVVARDIPATREILATYKRVNGIFLYADDGDVERALREAMGAHSSDVDDAATQTWADWVDGFADFCRKLMDADDIFDRLVNRIRSGDLLRKADMFEQVQRASASRIGADGVLIDSRGRIWAPAKSIAELLALDGEQFIFKAYVTLLKRLPDPGGLEHHERELVAGTSKLRLLKAMYSSPEGREQPVEDRIRTRAWLREAVRATAEPPVAVEQPSDGREVGPGIFVDATGREWVPAASPAEILILNNEDFVYQAYVSVLGRLPDADGLANGLFELRSGKDRARILREMINSPEGRLRPLETRIRFGGPHRSTDVVVPDDALPGSFIDDHGRHWAPSNHIAELLSGEDEPFLYKAYVSLLNRLPDEDGLANYRAQLGRGRHRLQILQGLRNSFEGRRLPLRVSGYRGAVILWNIRTLRGLLG